MNSRFVFLFTLLIALLSPFPGQADTPTLYYDLGLDSGWVPYQRGLEPGQPGVYAELMDALQQQSGIQIREVHMPPKRAALALNTGLVDFDFNVLEWMEDGTPGEGFVLSEPLYSVTEYLVTTPEHQHKYSEHEDYYGKPIGTIAGYFYFDDAKFSRVDFLSEEALILGLKKQRFEAIILEQHCAQYWASQHQLDIAFAVVHTSGPVRMRLREEHADLLPVLNKAIITLRKNGTIEKILRNYNIEDSL